MPGVVAVGWAGFVVIATSFIAPSPTSGTRLADDRELLPQHVGTDVDRDVVALSDKAGGWCPTPRAHRGDAALWLRRGVERELGAVAVRALMRLASGRRLLRRVPSRGR
jgi:hypothetical protein